MEETLERIAEESYAQIYAYCRQRVNDPEDAADITQSVFLALAAAYPHIDPTCVRQWLYNTAHNQVVDHYRKKRRERARFCADAPDESELGYGDEPFAYLQLAELPQYRQQLLDLLSDYERELCDDIRRYSRGEISYAALAPKYAVTEVTLRKRISRLKGKVHSLIRELLCLMVLGK